jgi:hypothetical protein
MLLLTHELSVDFPSPAGFAEELRADNNELAKQNHETPTRKLLILFLERRGWL